MSCPVLAPHLACPFPHTYIIAIALNAGPSRCGRPQGLLNEVRSILNLGSPSPYQFCLSIGPEIWRSEPTYSSILQNSRRVRYCLLDSLRLDIILNDRLQPRIPIYKLVNNGLQGQSRVSGPCIEVVRIDLILVRKRDLEDTSEGH